MSEPLKVIMWDVQHGNAIYMRTPGGKDFAVDLGTGSYGGSDYEFSPLLHLKNKWNVGYLDGLVITHPHVDHLDDIFNFDKLNPQILYRPNHLTEKDIRAGNQEKDKKIIDEYIAINKRFTNPLNPGTNAFLPANNGGAQIDVFVPNSCSPSNLNNHSAVTVVSCAGSKIIIPGDNEPPSWNELLERQDFVSAIKEADILVAPHHGRKSGFSRELFKHISPLLTLISDGPCDTTASDQYSNQSQGWTVHKRSGGKEERKCVTTRRDGVIEVKFGKNADGKSFIEVTID
jgi:beta-lactamase superfamily II metal-dependent hydrolase